MTSIPKVALLIDYDYKILMRIGRYGPELMTAWMELGYDFNVWKWRYSKKMPPME